MKKQLLFISSICILLCTKAQAQIVNGDFETWATVTNRYQEPVGWSTNNDQSVGFKMVYPTAPAHGGSKAMTVIRHYDAGYGMVFGGFATASFAYTGRPTAFTGFFKSYLAAGDTAVVGVILKKNGATVGTAAGASVISAPAYTSFTLNFNYVNGSTPDTAVVVVYCGDPFTYHLSASVPDDSVIVDDFGLTTGTGFYALLNDDDFNVYPNPSTGKLYINAHGMEGSTLRVSNLLGETVWQSAITDPKTEIDLSPYSKGIYFVQVGDGEKRQVRKVIIE